MLKMKPTEKIFDVDAVDGSMAMFTKLPGTIAVSVPCEIKEFGVATVDGIKLTHCEQARNAAGQNKLLVPIGQVADAYDATYTVHLEGFTGTFGRKFAPCTFEIKTKSKKQRDPAYAEHDEQALQAAREGMVLLKNENQTLPLKKTSVLNCFGEGQNMYRITATGASKINPRWAPNFKQAVADHSEFMLNKELVEFYKFGNRIPEDEMIERAKAQSDTAVVFITRHSGEGQDNRPIKGQYYLTDDEMGMLRKVSQTFEKTVLILNTGYPISMSWLEDIRIDAILYTGFAGMLSSYALVEILDGRTNPSGCLADTWSLDYYDSPVSKNQPVLGEGEPVPRDNALGVRIYYEEDIYNGYRYFDTFNKPVAYPFGHGLSYTEFDIQTEHFARDAEGVTLEFKVTNTGCVPGKKVVQVYVSAPDGRLEKPDHVLVGFDKTALLAPGESQQISMYIEKKNVASFDEYICLWNMEEGDYVLSVGSLNDLQEAARFTLTTNDLFAKAGHIGIPVEKFVRLKKGGTVDGRKSQIVPLRKRIAVHAERTPYRPDALPRYRGPRITWEMLKENPDLLDSYVAQMSLSELAKLNVCGGGRWGEGEDGCAGYTYAMKKYGQPIFTVSDANAGINIFKENIGFPASSVIACTFNKEIAYTVGRVIAEESVEHNIFLNLGPGMNIHRNMLCGRHPEYFSEDPLLTGVMAGYHGKGLEENGVACCYKHLFCNSSDLSRMGSHSIVPERALRELYYRCFEIAFKIHKPSAVMTSYNAMNGMYPAENAEILNRLLRTEWKFDGFIMSDWNSYHTVNAIEMVNAGNCWLTLGGMFWVWVIRIAAYTGHISRAVLENNVRWLIKTLLKWDNRE